MSRSSKLVEKPFEITLQFKNEKFNKKTKSVEREAGFYYYQKFDNPAEGEPKGENVYVPFPLKFIWLEDAMSVSGYNSKEEASVYSNEILTNPTNKLVKKYGVNPLTVKVGSEVVAKGNWGDIKEEVKGLGGKYTVPVYALAEIGGEWRITRFLFAGGSREVWFNLSKNRSKVENNFLIAEGVEEKEMKTGDTYQVPVINFGSKLDSSTLKLVEEATERVDNYFDFILSGEADSEATATPEEIAEAVEDTSDYN